MSTITTLCFYVFGVVCLSPWNFFITPQSYWNAKFSTPNATNGTLNEYQQFWDSSLSGEYFGFKQIKNELILSGHMWRSVYILLHWYHTDQLFLAESAFYYMSAQVSDFMTLVYGRHHNTCSV